MPRSKTPTRELNNKVKMVPRNNNNKRKNKIHSSSSSSHYRLTLDYIFVNWNNIFYIILTFNFPSHWISWFKRNITNTIILKKN